MNSNDEQMIVYPNPKSVVRSRWDSQAIDYIANEFVSSHKGGILATKVTKESCPEMEPWEDADLQYESHHLCHF